MENIDLEQAELEPCAAPQDEADISAVSATDKIDTEDALDEIEQPYDEEEDVTSLRAEFPELAGSEALSAHVNEERYATLRALGLTAREAFLATRTAVRHVDNRAHLGGSVPRRVAPVTGAMSASELRAARDLFGGVSDAELIRLYKRVTENH